MASGELAPGHKGRLVARFAAMRVRIADGAPQRIGAAGAQHMPGEEVWLVGEHRSSGERKYYLSNLPGDTPVKEVAGAIKPAGSVSRPISSSRKNWAWITLRTILDRPSPTRLDDDDGLRVPATSPPRPGGAEKRVLDLRPNPVCQQSGKPSLIACIDQPILCPHCRCLLAGTEITFLPK
jgi:hypothetical protein